MVTYIRCGLMAGLAASLVGCYTPTLHNTLGMPPAVQERLPGDAAGGKLTTQASAKSKEVDLAPDKAARLCMAAAEELEKGGHYAHAIAECELARQHSPNWPGLNRKLASLYGREGNFEKALLEYKRELVKNPKDADLLNDVGYCCYQMKDYGAAEKYLRQAVTLKPQLERAHANLGLALGRQEKWRECLEEFKKAGSNGAAHANLAAMYHAAGRDEDAQRECRIALGLDSQLKAARELLTKLEESSKETQAIQQADVKLSAQDTPSVQVAAATQESGAIQLKRPIVTKRVEPTFKPVR